MEAHGAVEVGGGRLGRTRRLDVRLTGDLVARARREAKLTQAALADRLGVSLRVVDRLERGLADPSPHLQGIADATGRPELWFRSGAARIDSTALGATREGSGSRIKTAIRLVTADRAARAVVLTSIVLLCTIRFFTGVIHVVPHLFNFVDVPIAALLIIFAGLHRASHPDAKQARLSLQVIGPAIAFLAVCIFAIVMNLQRVAIAPSALFIYGLLSPLVVYWATVRIWPTGNTKSVSRLLVVLLVLQFVVVVVFQLHKSLSTHNPDYITGTFGEDAYELVFLLLVVCGLIGGIFTFERGRPAARFAPLLVIGALAVVFLAQFRALLIISGVVLLIIGALLVGARGHRARGAVGGLAVVIAFALSLSVISTLFPLLRFQQVTNTLNNSPSFYLTTRLDALKKSIWPLYTDHPTYMLTGTGPGTYSSRAWDTFAFANVGNGFANAAGTYALALNGGKVYQTDVSERYIVPLLATVIQGSHALTLPFSEITSVAAEVGLVGLVLIVWVYLAALARSWQAARLVLRHADDGDPLPGVALAALTAFLLMIPMALLNNWLEVTRVTFIGWMLLAITIAEIRARPLASSTLGLTTGALGRAPETTPVSPSRLRPSGSALALDHLWRDLGIDEAIVRGASLIEVDPVAERALFYLVAKRALSPDAKLSLAEWARRYARLPGASGVGADQNAAADAVRFLMSCEEAIQHETFVRLAETLPLDLEPVLFTTIRTNNEMSGSSEYPVVGVAVTKTGIPLRCFTFATGSSDEEIVQRVRAKLGTWGIRNVIWPGADPTLASPDLRSQASADQLADYRRTLEAIQRDFQQQLNVVDPIRGGARLVHARVLLSFLAVTLIRVIEALTGASWGTVCHQLDKIELGPSPNNSAGVARNPALTASQREILAVLGIPEPAKAS